jgi:osmotically-inducible protein OsmY
MCPFNWLEQLDQGRIEFRRAPRNYRRSDERLTEEVVKRMRRAVGLDLSSVTVAVRGAHVILEGTVPERWMKYALENVSATVWGVEDVENHLRVLRER